jgi:hypothetical protein
VIEAVGILAHSAYALFFGAAAWFGEVTLCRIGCALIAAGFCYSVYRLGVFWKSPLPSERPEDCLSFYRQRLTERRDFLRHRVPLFIPSTHLGVALGCLGWILSEPRLWQEATGLALFYLGLHFAVRQMNSIEAARLQKEIELLGS